MTTIPDRDPAPPMAWVISKFAVETRGVVHALLLGVDGLAIAGSEDLDADLADKTAATASSLMSIAGAVGREYDAGAPEILTFRTTTRQFLVMAVADRGVLAVVAERNSNLGVLGNEMLRLVTALHHRLNPDPRGAGPVSLLTNTP